MDLPEIIKEYLILIIGAVAGGGLSFHFDKFGSGNKRSDVNVENNTNIVGNGNAVSNVNVVDNSRNVTNNYGGGNGKNTSDGGEIFAIFGLGFAGLVASVYFYSVYALTVFFYTTQAIQAIGTFAIAFGVVSSLHGTKSWEHHAVYVGLTLLLLSVGYWYCIPKLYAGYNPELASHALQHGPLNYFKALNSQSKSWIASQIIGVVSIVVALAFSLLFVVSNSPRPRIASLIICTGLLFVSAYAADGNIHIQF